MKVVYVSDEEKKANPSLEHWFVPQIEENGFADGVDQNTVPDNQKIRLLVTYLNAAELGEIAEESNGHAVTINEKLFREHVKKIEGIEKQDGTPITDPSDLYDHLYGKYGSFVFRLSGEVARHLLNADSITEEEVKN